ncbi:MAG TPA: ATP-binding protein [Gammaproteobacteria bacterium]|nr:ATP-binding protein [Gammaproteobacteria bacterium]
MSNINPEQASTLAKYFYKLAEDSQDVFWFRSIDYTEQIYVSPGFEDIWGITCQKLYDDPGVWISAMHSEDRERLRYDCSSRTAPMKPGEVIEKNYRIVRPDNSIRWIKDTSFGLFDDNGKCFAVAGTCKDVSKDVLHQQELQNQKQIAEMANQAKADFLAKMSHEFRTPLNAILGIGQILTQKELPPEVQEYVSIINQSGNILAAFVNDILDFAKIEIGEMSFSSEPFDLHVLFSQVMKSFEYQADAAKIKLTLDYPANIAKQVIGDAKRVRQILTNLVNNAMKFTDEGEVKVGVSCQKNNDNKGVFSVQVIDTGIGISENNHKFIFEKFGQIPSAHQRKHQGTGLGLSIVKELVERIGGNITVESKLGKGSTFTFSLPLQLQDSPLENFIDTKKKASHPINVDGKLGLNLLLVEDNITNQKIAKIMLEGIGCEVDIVNNGEEALSKLNASQSYDTILMDIGLPDMDGYEVASRIRKRDHLKNIPIIAMTAHAIESDKQKCLVSGMTDVIIKPIPYQTLYETLRSCNV